jgi:hypothetical protein
MGMQMAQWHQVGVLLGLIQIALVVILEQNLI